MESFDELPQPDFEGTVPTDALETDGENPNEMTDKQFGLLQDRMRQNGWLGGPIITDAEGLIADGEHRWRAADEIGLEEVPVRQYDIDDADRRLWRQELNKIHGEHDTKRDALEYDYLLDAGKADEVHELTQAADEDLDELLAEIKMETSASPAYEYDPDHNVYFEDCVEGMRERLDDDSVDMVFTSPPYNIDLDTDNFDGRKKDVEFYEDDRTFSEYVSFLNDVWTELDRVVKPNGHIFVNIGNRTEDHEIKPPLWFLDVANRDFASFIVWKKHMAGYASLGMPERGQFYMSWEPILHFSNDRGHLPGSGNNDVWEFPTAQKAGDDTGEHPAVFSTPLVTHAIQKTTSEGDTVLDPFMGSGTTAVAAIQNNRDYVGFELDEEGAYKPIIERRIGEAKRQRDAEVNADA